MAGSTGILAGFRKPRPAGTLKSATAALVSELGGPEAVVNISGVRIKWRSSVANWTDADDPKNLDKHIPADMIEVLEGRAEFPHVTSYLAQAQGYTLLRVLFDDADPDLSRDMAEAGEAFGTLIKDYALALSDGVSPGVVDKAEAGRILADTDKVLRLLMHGRARLIEKMGSGE